MNWEKLINILEGRKRTVLFFVFVFSAVVPYASLWYVFFSFSFFFPSSPAAAMTALAITGCIIFCVCSAKSNRQKDGFHRLRQHRDDYEDEIRLTSMGSKKSLLSHEFQDESESDEDTLYTNKH